MTNFEIPGKYYYYYYFILLFLDILANHKGVWVDFYLTHLIHTIFR